MGSRQSRSKIADPFPLPARDSLVLDVYQRTGPNHTTSGGGRSRTYDRRPSEPVVSGFARNAPSCTDSATLSKSYGLMSAHQQPHESRDTQQKSWHESRSFHSVGLLVNRLRADPTMAKNRYSPQRAARFPDRRRLCSGGPPGCNGLQDSFKAPGAPRRPNPPAPSSAPPRGLHSTTDPSDSASAGRRHLRTITSDKCAHRCAQFGSIGNPPGGRILGIVDGRHHLLNKSAVELDVVVRQPDRVEKEQH